MKLNKLKAFKISNGDYQYIFLYDDGAGKPNRYSLLKYYNNHYEIIGKELPLSQCKDIVNDCIKNSFQYKIKELILETSESNWYGTSCKPIPLEKYDIIFDLYNSIKDKININDPHPSASSDGNLYLRYNNNEVLFDIECIYNNDNSFELYICARNISNGYYIIPQELMNKSFSKQEIIDLMKQSFGSV